MNPKILHIHPDDTVASVLAEIAAGESITTGPVTLTAQQAIASGHKIALQSHAPGDIVRKFGQPIGRATAAIAAGAHVHSHNLETLLDAAGSLATQHGASTHGTASTRTWMGYDRGQRAGTRNEIWIIPTVGCVARTAQRIAGIAAARHADAVDGIFALTHPHGCSQLGDDLDGTRAIIAALAAHPNAGGILLVGLGCESNQIVQIIASLPDDAPPCRHIVTQQSGDETAEGLALVDELVAAAREAKRVALPLSRLVVGLKCGGSDGLSGLTANPLLGRFAETLTASGGCAILSEIPEIFGAEHLLLARATNAEVAVAGQKLVDDFKAYFRRHDEPVSENPSPGNIAGGITTLEEKSLGAVQKAGRAPLADVLRYGERVAAAGVSLLEAPGNDAVSSTAMTAAGATLLLFTTGRGTPLGFPAPTIKVASNADLAARKPGWIDFDASPALGGDLADLDAHFLDCIIAHASGEATAAERNGEREIAIWKRGVTL